VTELLNSIKLKADEPLHDRADEHSERNTKADEPLQGEHVCVQFVIANVCDLVNACVCALRMHTCVCDCRMVLCIGNMYVCVCCGCMCLSYGHVLFLPRATTSGILCPYLALPPPVPLSPVPLPLSPVPLPLLPVPLSPVLPLPLSPVPELLEVGFRLLPLPPWK
jgi:hypothetical protein